MPQGLKKLRENRSFRIESWRPGENQQSLVPKSEAQDCILGYSQPSLRDWFEHTPIADLFQSVLSKINR
jgi:hypothetical protein